jgi:hypothetical protein
MPRQKSIVTIIRDMVRSEIQRALGGLFGGLRASVGSSTPKPKNGRRRRRRRTKKVATTGVKRRRGGRRKGSQSEG